MRSLSLWKIAEPLSRSLTFSSRGHPLGCAFACFFLHVIGLPPYTIEVGFPLFPVETISRRIPFSRLQPFLYVQAPSLLASQIVPTAATYRRAAAEAFTSEQNMLRFLRMHRIC